MIPQILELKNFLSYGDLVQRIDFKDYHLICFSGKNGNGKSALLDAMTWALWGQARKIAGTSKADDGLVRLGQTRMMVSLEFSFSDRIYRVRREYSKAYGKPYVALDFEVFDSIADRFISLTDKTIRATQAKIELLIGLDYETFINSAFIRQGQSNEFSKKSAKERKQILATILGLSKYDILQQHALEKIRTINDEKKGIIAIQEQYALDLAKEADIAVQLSPSKSRLIEQTKQLDALQTQLKLQEKELIECQARKNRLIDLLQECQEKENIYQNGINKLGEKRCAWKKVHAQSLSLPDFATLQEQRKQLFLEEKRILELQQKTIMLQEKILHAKDAYQKRGAILKNEYDQALNSQRLALERHELGLNHQRSLVQQKTLQKQLLADTIKTLYQEKEKREMVLAQQKDFELQFIALKNQFEKRRTFYQTLVQKGNWAKNELAELEHKQKVVDDDNNPACPLCQQLLTAKRKQFLAQQFKHTETFAQHRLGRISMLLKKLKELLIMQHDHVAQQSKQAELYTQNALQLEELIKKISHEERDFYLAAQDGQQLLEQEKQLALMVKIATETVQKIEQSYQETVLHDADLTTITQLLNNLEQEKQACSLNEQAHQKLQETIMIVDAHITQYEAVKQSLEQQQTRKLAIQGLCHDLKNISKAIIIIKKELEAFAVLEITEKQIIGTIEQLLKENQVILAEKELLLHAIGSLEHELKRLETLKEDMQQKTKMLKKLDNEIEDYQILSIAMSKNGIQALLIEDAIPEVEQEANAILARLTDNQAQIFIESLRDLKSGGVRETLDIQIADSCGMRPYEMYSGGEAFRVDFSLRIAIAKLLARRSGTALQTLIIDEGFGSQDEEGLSHIMDALYAIQGDFSKIIIVSHLPEFKHNFPVHFVIEKGPSGSIVSVEERG